MVLKMSTVDLPVSTESESMVLQIVHKGMAWRNPEYVVDNSLRTRHIQQLHEMREGLEIDLPRWRQRRDQEALEFGSEDKRALLDRVVERLDAHSIAGAEQSVAALIVNDERKHAVQIVDHTVALLVV